MIDSMEAGRSLGEGVIRTRGDIAGHREPERGQGSLSGLISPSAPP